MTPKLVFIGIQARQTFLWGQQIPFGEILVQHAVSNNSLDARIVRPFNAYGPRLPGDAYGQVTGKIFPFSNVTRGNPLPSTVMARKHAHSLG
ncbi:MAG: hypothetical protein Ct9H90mP16_17420 [Candidatus Poseidoniales archaeon]|nr:MAG: hypothetical protein Ct9H90mP16_17420 [Candidatus Poseidoniales archaeon]